MIAKIKVLQFISITVLYHAPKSIDSTLGWHPVVIFSLKEKVHFNVEIQSIEFTSARLSNMLPVPLRESSFAPVFHAGLTEALVIILQCLVITVLALRSCPAVSAVVACSLGLCLLA